MKQLQFLLILLALPLAANAEENRSIMFGDPEPSWKGGAAESAIEKQSQHCNALQKKIKELKGKPQRRYAASERFKLECQGRQAN